ncbi:hypothetical protein PIB30_013387 [Stylosanthes scabra]|uniref:Uncharacterized protein n=1 Tax=Stylosanthes scabra TaxID=79078 RepID=A0ABU6W603_9FABA|nr:hypothetical protein [Stylosanthes scabra]
MNVNKFYETDVPTKAKADNHALTKYNGGVGFLSQTKVELGTMVQLWSLKDFEEDNTIWEKMITVTGISIIYNPTIFLGKTFFLLLKLIQGLAVPMRLKEQMWLSRSIRTTRINLKMSCP